MTDNINRAIREAIKETDFYKLFQYVSNLERLGVYKNVWDLSIDGMKRALHARRLYHIETGAEILGEDFNECFAVLFIQYGIILNSPDIDPVFEKMQQIGAVKYDICMSGNQLEVLLNISSCTPEAFTQIDWMPVFYSAQQFFSRKGFDISHNDPLTADFLQQLLQLCECLGTYADTYRELMADFKLIAESIAPANVHLISDVVSAVNSYHYTTINGQTPVSVFVDLAMKMKQDIWIRN